MKLTSISTSTASTASNSPSVRCILKMAGVVRLFHVPTTAGWGNLMGCRIRASQYWSLWWQYWLNVSNMYQQLSNCIWKNSEQFLMNGYFSIIIFIMFVYLIFIHLHILNMSSINKLTLTCCVYCCIWRFHKCKMSEHDLLCTNVRVSCLNAGYGCPHTMPRHAIAMHLPQCPASVVVCGCERNRWLVDTPAREITSSPKDYMKHFNPSDLGNIGNKQVSGMSLVWIWIFLVNHSLVE